MLPWVDDVIRFWFEELSPKEWWKSSTTLDDRIRARFGALHRALVDEPLATTLLDAREHLAAVIVYDQFSRNLFRGSPGAFASDPLALAVTDDAIERRMDRELESAQRHFLYMPLMHAENELLQERSVRLFGTLEDTEALRSALDHRETIRRFGRFPQRNAALGRTSTREEQASLAGRLNPSSSGGAT